MWVYAAIAVAVVLFVNILVVLALERSARQRHEADHYGEEPHDRLHP